jgi:hypothetical protein
MNPTRASRPTRVIRRVGAGASSRTRRRRPAVLVAGVLLLAWLWVVLGSDLPLLLTVLAAAAGATAGLRRRPEYAAGVAVAIGTAAAPAVTCLIVMTEQAPGAADVVAVLTGYILVAPIPAMLAFSRRPTVIRRPVNALLGSLILLLGTVPVVMIGDRGDGAPMLAGALLVSGATVWIRQQRAGHALVADLPVEDGWTDLGTRTLPDGTTVHRLLLGRGHAVAAAHSGTSTPGPAALDRAVHRAITVADTLGLPASRVQPVLLTGTGAGLQRRVVTTGQATASVIITGTAGLSAVTGTAPRCWTATRRPLLTAAVLPTTSHAGSR